MNAEAINSVIDNLATRLSVPAEKLLETVPAFGVYQVAYFIAGILLILAGIVLHTIGWNGLSKLRAEKDARLETIKKITDPWGETYAERRENRLQAQQLLYELKLNDNDDAEHLRRWSELLQCLYIMTIATGLAISCRFLGSVALWFYNPQAWAVKYLLGLFAGKV